MDKLNYDIQFARTMIENTSEDDPVRAVWLGSLGAYLGDKYFSTNSSTILEEAITVTREAISFTSLNDHRLAWHLNNLGNLLHDSSKRTGEMASLEESIQVSQRAIDMTSKQHPIYAGMIFNFGISLRYRAFKTSTTSDLDKAIELTEDAMKGAEDHPDREGLLDNLGDFLFNRYLAKRNMPDLERSISIARSLIGTRVPADRARYLYNLAIRLRSRYISIGSVEDLDEALSHGDTAINIDPESPRLWDSLANLLCDRYDMTGAIADLDEAIDISRETISNARGHHPDKEMLLRNLAVRLNIRYSRTKSLDDLQEAIRLAQEAVDICSNDHPFRPFFLSALSGALNDRYLHSHQSCDLEQATQLRTESLNLTLADHPSRPFLLSDLADVLHNRYLEANKLEDLEQAISAIREAVNAGNTDIQNCSIFLNKLGHFLGEKYLNHGEDSLILSEAISCHISALEHDKSSTLNRLLAAREALRFCILQSDWNRAYKVSEKAINLLPRLTARSLQNSDKQYMLSQFSGFASDAAAVALNLDGSALLSLNWLELGRGILAASLDELRTDIVDLQNNHPELAERFIILRRFLELPTINMASSEDAKFDWQGQKNRRYTASRDIEKLIIEIRAKPGFEDFLLAPREEDMRRAADCGPIVVINVSELRCDAILITRDGIRSIHLPDLKKKEIENKAQNEDTKSIAVLEWLWDALASPILECLGYRKPYEDEKPARVWWIPTGALTKFPIHAAGRHYKGSFETVLDRVISSYSISVKAIINGRRRPSALLTQKSALLVAMENTTGQTSLPSATQEIETVYTLCPSMGLDPIQPETRKQEITSRLEHCRIFHFAGHGYTDNLDPLQSHLLLDDWKTDKLTVANLLEVNLRNTSPFMAYLSACGTGQIKDEMFVDESIHLISACQLAGFRHVIGSLWEVKDNVCSDMARLTYEGMVGVEMTDETVCRALHEATVQLRDRWLQNAEMPGLKDDVYSDPAQDENAGEEAAISQKTHSRQTRNFEYFDDGRDTEPMQWAPYVHFGV